MPLSHSEAGRLGAEKSKIISALKKEERIKSYLVNPNLCKFCSNIIPYQLRTNIFCGSSCSATFNNVKRASTEKAKCINCDNVLKGRKGKYCNITCQKEREHKQNLNDWLVGNSNPTKGTIRKHLINQYGYCCAKCGITSYNNQPITLEIEHKDGDSYNNKFENLCFLCPNCHSQTPTYKGKNRGNGRHSRRQRYKEGKSY